MYFGYNYQGIIKVEAFWKIFMNTPCQQISVFN